MEQGALSRDDAAKMSEADALHLIFLPGLSTAPTVSETSGRGVGMDAVKTAMERLKGSIDVEAHRAGARSSGFGCRSRWRSSTGCCSRSARGCMPCPFRSSPRSRGSTSEDLVTIEGRKTLLLRDQIISIVSLEELFGVPGNGSEKKYVLILALGGRRIGLLIDRLMWQQELVIKAIDDVHVRTEYVSGGSILGSGKVVLILDVQAVIRRAIEEEKNKRQVAR